MQKNSRSLEKRETEKKLRVMIIGAHPDDCEAVAGIAIKLIKNGHKVKFLSATNGQSGHQENMGGKLAQIRWNEAKKVAKLASVEYDFMDNDDGFLTTDLKTRQYMIKAIREWYPDVIITHRPNDYHPDHRNTSILVEDSSYLVCVPNVCKMTPVLRYMPVIFYMYDDFTRPYKFSQDFVFDIDDVYEDKMRLYHQYASQMYEWLPWCDNIKDRDKIPKNDKDRFEWLLATRGRDLEHIADECRDNLIKKYGARKGKMIKHCEALEQCEYGAKFTPEEMDRYFNF